MCFFVCCGEVRFYTILLLLPLQWWCIWARSEVYFGELWDKCTFFLLIFFLLFRLVYFLRLNFCQIYYGVISVHLMCYTIDTYKTRNMLFFGFFLVEFWKCSPSISLDSLCNLFFKPIYICFPHWKINFTQHMLWQDIMCFLQEPHTGYFTI